MTTQSAPRFRFFIVVSAVIVLILSILFASEAFKTVPEIASHPTARGMKIPAERKPKKDSPISQPTDFYVELNAPDVHVKKEVRYSEAQVSLNNILLLYTLRDGDLLANYTLTRAREFVTEEQLIEAQLLTKEYDANLKELRRQRAVVLEQAGVSIKDPEEKLAIIRTKMFQVFSEVRRRIFNEVLDAQQRKLIVQSEQRRVQQIKDAKLTAEKQKAFEQ